MCLAFVINLLTMCHLNNERNLCSKDQVYSLISDPVGNYARTAILYMYTELLCDTWVQLLPGFVVVDFH